MNRKFKYTFYSILIAIGVFSASYAASYNYFTTQVYHDSMNQLELYTRTLRSKLFELQPLNRVLSHRPDILRALNSPEDAAQILLVNETLQKSKVIAAASEIYLMDKDGLTIAASNWQKEVGGFVGNNFGYRPYFQQAITGQSGQFYAVGIRSNIRGYYFSEPVYDGDKIRGVLVLKVAIDNLEKIFKDTDNKLMILDDLGIVFLASDTNYLYKKTRKISDKGMAYLEDTRRYRDKILGVINIKSVGFLNRKHIVQMQTEDGFDNYIYSQLAMPTIGWTIVSFVNENKAITASIIASSSFSFSIVSLYLLLLVLSSKRRLQAEQMEFKNRQAAELERRVEARTEELKQAQDELVQTAKLAALGQMSAAISHELSQPLTSISNYVENAKKYIDNDEIDQVKTNIGYIGILSEKMAAIIHHTKVFASKRPSEIETISLNKVIRETVWFMQSKFKRRDVRLKMSIPKKDVSILANSIRIEQVLMNLISNALESMQKSAVKILSIEMTLDADMAVIIIRDTGEGIDEKSIEAIFKPFFTTKADDQGMGMGLSISRAIIEEYDGILEAFNRPSGGARFEIKLPIGAES